MSTRSLKEGVGYLKLLSEEEIKSRTSLSLRWLVQDDNLEDMAKNHMDDLVRLVESSLIDVGLELVTRRVKHSGTGSAQELRVQVREILPFPDVVFVDIKKV